MRAEASTDPTAPSPAHADAGAPLFVAGPDRSGTTLMFALLASHPDVAMVRRTNVWRYFHGRYGSLADDDNARRCVRDMTRYRRMRHLHPDPERILREFLGGPRTYGRLFSLFFAHHAEREGRRRFGDKSLHTEHHARAVFRELPDARIVHMVRDPRDRYASVRRRNDQDLSRVGAATGRWLASTRAGLRNAATYPDRYLLVRYEDLVADPERTLRGVCAHVGLEFTPAMLTLDGLPQLRDRGGNSSFGDVEAGAISTRAVGRYRQAVRPGELAFIQLWSRRELRRLGYQRVDTGLGLRLRLRFWLWDLPVDSARMTAFRLAAAWTRRRGERVPAFRLTEECDLGGPR